MKNSVLCFGMVYLVKMIKNINKIQNFIEYRLQVHLPKGQNGMSALTEIIGDVFIFLRENRHIYVYDLVFYFLLVFYILMQLKVFYKELLLPYIQLFAF